jgi:hypothetical protein
VIIHNVIIGSERGAPTDDAYPFDFQESLAEVEQVPVQFAAFLRMHEEIRDAGVHTQLKNDIVEHLWAWRGNAA